MLALRYPFNVIFTIISAGILSACNPQLRYQHGHSIAIDSSIKADQTTDFWVQLYTDSMSTQMNEVIGYTSTPFQKIRYRSRITHEQQKKANLARLVADHTLEWAQEYAKSHNLPQPELAILNHNGLRNSLNAGPIKVSDVFEIMPFDNQIVLVVMSGTQMAALFDFIAKLGGTPFAGGELFIDSSNFKKAIIQGNAFDSRRSYCIATLDFLQTGGDGFTMFKNPKKLITTDQLLRDVLLQSIRNESIRLNNDLDPRSTPRIIHQ
jgi:2',3'-cyclic-nucleotide 2'-phosphodiesterase (5'-nucleotidase family)